MLSMYPAAFIKEASGYSVIFPDLDNLATCGKNLEEAMEMAVDCLAGYLYSLEKEGKNFPQASDVASVNIDSIKEDLDIDDAESAFVNVVSVDVKEYAKKHFERAVKKTLTIPAWLNAAAREKGLNFSQVLQEALKARIQSPEH